MQIEDFNATNIPPRQMGDKHPVGMYPAQISDTYGKANKNSPGGQFCVEFTTAAGKVVNRYNLWNNEPKAVEIAQNELSALCHACGIFQLSFKNVAENEYGRELRGARCSIKVDLQDVTKPDGYVEVKKIFDINGNEPGKSGGNTQPQPQQSGSWGGGAQQQPQNQQPAAQQPQGGGWSAGPNVGQPAAQQQQPSNNQAGGPPWAR